MSAWLDHFGAVVGGVAFVFGVAALVLFGVRWWISATADLIWISVLRPRLTLLVWAPITFGVMVVVYAAVPERTDAFWALPVLAAVVFTPVPSRLLVNWIAKKRYRPGPTVKLDAASLKFIDVFSLAQLDILADYRAPETAKTVSPPPP